MAFLQTKVPVKVTNPNKIIRYLADKMKWLMFISLGLMGMSSPAQSLRQVLLRANSQLQNVRIIPCKASPELFIAILVEENHWWETSRIVRFKNHQIVWQASIDTLPEGQSIYTARQISLTGFPDLFIEVFDMTHMGNGFYYLYSLHGSHARLMLQTRAVDRNMDGAEQVGDSVGCSQVYKNDSLTSSYTDLNHDGYADIHLTGVVLTYAQDDKTLLRQCPIQKVFLYNKKRHRFIEDPRRGLGLFEPDSH
jgi:hypothetical protein